MDTKLCIHCNKEKSLDEFKKPNPYCKSCKAEKARQFRAAYTTEHGKGYRGSNKIKKISTEDRKLMSLIRKRIVEARGRAKKFNQIEINIDEDYMYQMMNNQDRKCAATGCNFVIEKQHPLCPSLDKIIPGKGYTKGNVQWLSWAANRAKGDLDQHDFITMCKRVVEVSERATTIP